MSFIAVDCLVLRLDISTRCVHQLVVLGMPKQGRGKYDLVECLKWLCRYQRDLIAKREIDSSANAADAVRRARAELISVQREQHELQL